MLSYDKGASSLHSGYHHSAVQPSTATPAFRHKHIFIVTGPAGCGKTTVATQLANFTDLPYLEGDDFHPQSNVEKMSQGIPLTDADRWDWLVVLREAAVDQLDAGSPGVVLTCSALKRKYRDVIRIARYNDHDVLVHFIYLDASEEVLMRRVAQRKGHYMKSDMVLSQLQALEQPNAHERDVHTVDVSGSQAEIQQTACGIVRDILAQDMTTRSAKKINK